MDETIFRSVSKFQLQSLLPEMVYAFHALLSANMVPVEFRACFTLNFDVEYGVC